MFNRNLYINVEYQNYVGRKVIVKYSPVKPEIIYVFDLDENFLFTAARRKKYGFELTDEDYAEANREKKLARSALLNGYKPGLEVRSTEAIGRHLEDYADCMDKTDAPEPQIIELVRNEKTEESVRRYHSSSIDKNYEDVMKASEKIKKDADERQKGYINKFMKDMLDRAEATAKRA